MATDMTNEERRAFLMEGTRTGKLATTRKDGSPHVAPIWFVLDGDDVILTTGSDSLKGKSLLRDNRVALTVDDERPPYSFVAITGTAAISDDLDDMLCWATKLGSRYMGEDRAEEFGRRNAVPGEILVRITPSRVVAKKDVSA